MTRMWSCGSNNFMERRYYTAVPAHLKILSKNSELLVINSRADIEIVARFGARGYRGEDQRHHCQLHALAIIRRVHAAILVASAPKDPMIDAEPAWP